MRIRILAICLVALALCGCNKDFKVWKDYNADYFAEVRDSRSETLKTTPSGVLYEVVWPTFSTEPKPHPGYAVRITYTGKLVDGTIIQSGEEVDFWVDDLVVGLQEALYCMPRNERWRIYIPYELGYGEDGLEASNGNFVVPPYSTLIFDIILHEVGYSN